MKKGKIILLEGTDGSGKNTQARMLVEMLNQNRIPSVMRNFPRYETPTGRIIAECYLGKTGNSWFSNPVELNPKIASLYYAADRLAAKNLILDRYVESNMAHQGGKLKGEERKKFIDFVEKLEYGLLELPRPDRTIFLYVPTEVAIKLRKQRNEIPDAHERNFEHLKNAEEAYLELSEKFSWKKIECVQKGEIRNRESIAEEIYQRLELWQNL